MAFFKKIRDQLPLLGLLLLIFTLYINNMPIDFVINPSQIFNPIKEGEIPSGYHNQKILSLSNIILLITFIIIYFVLNDHKENTDNGQDFIFQKNILYLIVVIFGIYSVIWAFFKFVIFDLLKGNNYIKNVIIYDWDYYLSYSFVSLVCMLVICGIYWFIIKSDSGGVYVMYSLFALFILCIMFLYLRWDGFWDLLLDLTEGKIEEWKKEYKDNPQGTIVTSVSLGVFILCFMYYEMSKRNLKEWYEILIPFIFLCFNAFLAFQNKKLYSYFAIFYIIYAIYTKIKDKFDDTSNDEQP